MYKALGCLLLLIVASQPSCSTANQAQQEKARVAEQTNYLNESQEDRDQRMKWWREARFGMFIHWGLYAVPAGEYEGKRSDRTGEWIQEWANIPREDYEKFAPQFNPVEFDAAEWAQLAQDAGMQYLVITSKHHDGFSIFDSEVSDYDIVDSTPYGKDPIVELSRECKKRSIKFCFYYSIMDWHHPSQYVEAEGKHPTAGHGQNRIIEDQRDDYIKYMKAQLKELVEKYDPEVLWFDGEWTDWWTETDGKDLYNYVRSLKPSIIINNDTWGYVSYDDNWKSEEVLLHNLIDIASKGGNFLLNVGPTSEGLIPEPSVLRLKAMGEWLKVNGESIYATGPSPFNELGWGRATTKGNKIYLHIFDWPTEKLVVPAIQQSVARAYPLFSPSDDLKVSQTDEGVSLEVPKQAPDAIATVIVLELES
jgi:alpha-L-fucosidase